METAPPFLACHRYTCASLFHGSPDQFPCEAFFWDVLSLITIRDIKRPQGPAFQKLIAFFITRYCSIFDDVFA